jgi:hypothetical protein
VRFGTLSEHVSSFFPFLAGAVFLCTGCAGANVIVISIVVAVNFSEIESVFVDI